MKGESRKGFLACVLLLSFVLQISRLRGFIPERPHACQGTYRILRASAKQRSCENTKMRSMRVRVGAVSLVFANCPRYNKPYFSCNESAKNTVAKDK